MPLTRPPFQCQDAGIDEKPDISRRQVAQQVTKIYLHLPTTGALWKPRLLTNHHRKHGYTWWLLGGLKRLKYIGHLLPQKGGTKSQQKEKPGLIRKGRNIRGERRRFGCTDEKEGPAQWGLQILRLQNSEPTPRCFSFGPGHHHLNWFDSP